MGRSRRPRPPAGSLYARSVSRFDAETPSLRDLQKYDIPLSNDLPAVPLASEIPVSVDVPLLTDALQNVAPTAAVTIGSGPLVTEAVSPQIITENDPLEGVSPVIIAPIPSATKLPLSVWPDEPSHPPSHSTRPQPATATRANRVQHPSSVSAPSKFTTVVLPVSTSSPRTTQPSRSISASYSYIGSIPSTGVNFLPISTFLASTGTVTSSIGSTTPPPTTTISMFNTTQTTHPTTVTYIPTSSSTPTATADGHTTLFWIGIAAAALMGFILVLLILLLGFNVITHRRTQMLWSEDYFTNIHGHVARHATRVHGKLWGWWSKDKTETEKNNEGDGLTATVSSIVPYPPGGETSRQGAARSDHQYHSLVPPEPSHIAVHNRSTSPIPPSPSQHNEYFGTPRTDQAAPFMREGLQDGGLPYPYQYEEASADAERLLVPPEAAHGRDNREVARNHSIATTRLSSRYWESEREEDHSSSLSATGWAKALRNNLGTACEAMLGRRGTITRSDPGSVWSEGALTRHTSRARSARSRASVHFSAAGGLYRTDSEASRYSQASSAALMNPFVNNHEASEGARRTVATPMLSRGPSAVSASSASQYTSAAPPSWQNSIDLGVHTYRSSRIPVSDSMRRKQKAQQVAKIGLGSAPDPNHPGQHLRVPAGTGPALGRGSNPGLVFMDGARKDNDSIFGTSALAYEQPSDVEAWEMRRASSPMRTLWPSASSRLTTRGGQKRLGTVNDRGMKDSQGGTAAHERQNAIPRLSSGRRFLRKRSSHDGIATSDDE
ncbi:hypothetical protein DL93DRAFT_2076494 [Clavulina sp. PMI_390]|nr:hypothetical protein DL93DRAFT_2076494 [Clavulina sp. PMI_390]